MPIELIQEIMTPGGAWGLQVSVTTSPAWCGSHLVWKPWSRRPERKLPDGCMNYYMDCCKDFFRRGTQNTALLLYYLAWYLLEIYKFVHQACSSNNNRGAVEKYCWKGLLEWWLKEEAQSRVWQMKPIAGSSRGGQRWHSYRHSGLNWI